MTEIEDAQFEEMEPKKRARISSALTYVPQLRQRGAANFEIVGMREDGSRFPWGYWGAFLLALATLLFFWLRGSAGYYSMSDMLVALLLGGGATMFYRWGPRDSLRRHVLATVDAERRQLRWGEDGGAQITLDFDDVQEIVFAMIRFPVSPTRPDARIHVYTLLVRDAREELVPVIEASPNKGETFHIAKQLSAVTGVAITQVGEGILGGAIE